MLLSKHCLNDTRIELEYVDMEDLKSRLNELNTKIQHIQERL